MTRYIARRLLLTVPVVWAVTLVLFCLLRLTPGDPIRNQFGLDAPPEQVESARESLGLNRPIAVQYLDWTAHMFQGDFGHSIQSGRPVADEIRERLPATLELQLVAFVIAIGVALPLGTLSAVKQGSRISTAASAWTLVSLSLPGFFVGTMLVYLFTFKFRLFETPRYVPFTEDPVANLSNLVLPALALSYAGVAFYARFIRASVLDVLDQPYIRTARSKGLRPWTVVTRHALRNALIPVITLIALSLATLWTGAFIMERIFNWPGIGRLGTQALMSQDYPVVQALVFLVAIAYAVANLLADIAYTWADPRVRYDGHR